MVLLLAPHHTAAKDASPSCRAVGPYLTAAAHCVQHAPVGRHESRDAVHDGVRHAQLVADQFLGLWVVPGRTTCNSCCGAQHDRLRQAKKQASLTSAAAWTRDQQGISTAARQTGVRGLRHDRSPAPFQFVKSEQSKRILRNSPTCFTAVCLRAARRRRLRRVQLRERPRCGALTDRLRPG